jgi:DnaK suppressor protein
MPTEHLSRDQIAELVRQLTQKQTALESQLEHSEQGTKPVTLDQQSVGRVSRMDAMQQQQMSVATREQAALLLKDISSALSRIDSDEYGYCQDCGESVGFARLQAQPQALLCLACQSELEQN